MNVGIADESANGSPKCLTNFRMMPIESGRTTIS